jgi:hypothetical protein
VDGAAAAFNHLRSVVVPTQRVLYRFWATVSTRFEPSARKSAAHFHRIRRTIGGVPTSFASTEGLVLWKHYIKWIEDECCICPFLLAADLRPNSKRAFDAYQLPVFRQTLHQNIAT